MPCNLAKFAVAGKISRNNASRVPFGLKAMPYRAAIVRTARPRLLRQMNERTVFELIRQRGQASRAEIKRAMGVSAPTVSKAVERLLAVRLIESIGTAPHAPAGGAGRPVTVYRIAGNDVVRVLGAAIAVHESAVVVSGLDGNPR